MSLFLCCSLYETVGYHIPLGLLTNRSQKMSKCGENFSDTLACGSSMPHFDVNKITHVNGAELACSRRSVCGDSAKRCEQKKSVR